ncbi:LIC_10091 family protein [Archangium violaceum]|uniref:LIC_10091 family protein n=1 Tax=Archangium violaceum TaxID=83451 RepID=UPI0036DD5826
MSAMRVLALVVLLASAVAAASEPEPELTGSIQLPADPTPPELIRDSHYWISNEDHLGLFHEVVKDKRGVYLGVGSDQNYLLGAWARAELLVLMDFDQSIVDLHRVYRLIFLAAETPEEFLRLWSRESREEVRRLIQENAGTRFEKASLLRAYGTARWAVERRLKRVVEQMRKASLPSFVVDAGDYAHIRGLYQRNKVLIVRGDLTANRTVAAIGRTTTRAGKKLGVLYLSNAEQYFPYDRDYRSNMRALPLDDTSVVVRTSGQRGITHVKGTYYHYNTQSGSSFLAWLEDVKTRDVRGMLRYAPDTGKPRGLSRLDMGPTEAREALKQKLLEKRTRRMARN